MLMMMMKVDDEDLNAKSIAPGSVESVAAWMSIQGEGWTLV